jgi:hypothetical protein
MVKKALVFDLPRTFTLPAYDVFPSNYVKTTKYTPASFVPVSLL